MIFLLIKITFKARTLLQSYLSPLIFLHHLLLTVPLLKSLHTSASLSPMKRDLPPPPISFTNVFNGKTLITMFWLLFSFFILILKTPKISILEDLIFQTFYLYLYFNVISNLDMPDFWNQFKTGFDDFFISVLQASQLR